MAKLDWDDLLAEESAQETSGGTWEDLPDGAWVLVRSENNPDLDWAKPKVRTFQGKKDTTKSYSILELRGRAVGGDMICSSDIHKNQMCRIEAFLHPNAKRKESGILGGKAKGLLNSLFACGAGGEVEADLKGDARKDALEARTRSRLNVSYNLLRERIDAEGLLLETYNGDKARMLGAAAVLELRENPRYLIVKVKHNQDGEYLNVDAVTILDATPANVKAKGIEIWDEAAQTALAESESF
jgi:hypothetical protein